jgi:hypothetical protein
LAKIVPRLPKKKAQKNGDANASLLTTTQKKKKYLGETSAKKKPKPLIF